MATKVIKSLSDICEAYDKLKEQKQSENPVVYAVHHLIHVITTDDLGTQKVSLIYAFVLLLIALEKLNET